MDAENRILRQTVWLKLNQPPTILGYAARLDLQSIGSDAPAAPSHPAAGQTPTTPVIGPGSTPPPPG